MWTHVDTSSHQTGLSYEKLVGGESCFISKISRYFFDDDLCPRRAEARLPQTVGHGAYRVIFDGDSYRAPKPLPDMTGA
jgi:hypothetical protein